jgi:long-chain acyl-CoA synthetase
MLDDVNHDLVSHERLRMLVVAREAWTMENGQLTPTMKIKRSRIEASVAPQVEAWYGQHGAVLWA